MRTLVKWGLGAIVIPRWVLVVKYATFILIGITVYLASSPSLDITTSNGYTPLWSIAVTITASVSLIGSLRQRWERMEGWAVLCLAALLIGYAAAPLQLVVSGDHDRAAYSALALALSVLPSARAWMLIRRAGSTRG